MYQAVEHFTRIFEIKPEIIAHDFIRCMRARSGVQTAAVMEWITGLPKVAVQHHHATLFHAWRSTDWKGRVWRRAGRDGVRLDNTVWGGEILIASGEGFTEMPVSPGQDARRGHGGQISQANGAVISS